MRFWYCIDDIGDKWLYKGSVAPVKYEDIWNNSDEEMVEIRIKCTAEKCE